MRELSSKRKVELFVPKSANPELAREATIASGYLSARACHPSGRPALDTDTLTAIRDDLVHLLSVSWADVGWHLRHAKSPEDLRRAFEPLKGKNNNPLIERFIKTGVSATSGEELRLTRKALGEAIRRKYEAQGNCDDPVKSYHERETAAMQSRAELLGKLRREVVERRSKLRAVSKELRSAERLERRLEKQLAVQEVGFAQHQLVRILKEGRCACNPLRLANAMTGLLLLTARVSYNRCSKMKCAVWPEFDFQVFEKIEAIWNSRHRYRDLSVVELYRQEIKKLPRTMRRDNAENYLRTRLAQDFGYLKLAIEQGLESGADSDQMPFLITSSFNNNRQSSRTALTRTLAAIEKID